LDYEMWCIQEVARGRRLSPHAADGTSTPTIQLQIPSALLPEMAEVMSASSTPAPPLDNRVRVDKVDILQWTKLTKGSVIQMPRANYPFVDFATVVVESGKKVVYLFQATTGVTHKTPMDIGPKKNDRGEETETVAGRNPLGCVDIAAARKHCGDDSIIRYVVLGPTLSLNQQFKFAKEQQEKRKDGVSVEYAKLCPAEEGEYTRSI
jgi:hypothetical protein